LSAFFLLYVNILSSYFYDVSFILDICALFAFLSTLNNLLFPWVCLPKYLEQPTISNSWWENECICPYLWFVMQMDFCFTFVEYKKLWPT
jgi:hypothetical protein